MLCSRCVREQDLDTPAIEKRFAYTFLQQLIEYVDKAHQHMMDTGTLYCRPHRTAQNKTVLWFKTGCKYSGFKGWSIVNMDLSCTDAGTRAKGEERPQEQQTKFFGKV